MRHMLVLAAVAALAAAACSSPKTLQPSGGASRVASAAVAMPAEQCDFDQFSAGKRCFDTADTACASLGCDNCAELESAPVQVVCED